MLRANFNDNQLRSVSLLMHQAPTPERGNQRETYRKAALMLPVFTLVCENVAFGLLVASVLMVFLNLVS